ncbi:M56 family metallopeptidase [Dyella choica]|uniref:M56 family metallopeptidase n=1 Tax=Dyella choica TaxID=1927959 RepID=A0A432M5A5_9GAMM|nr:M56 family metallopeptidase [Dyella choica]RUL74926.1 M56 family metallopeptidase [Dyella choica]
MSSFTTLADSLLARLAWSSVQAALLIAVLWLVMRSLPRLSPAVRCTLWWLVGAQLVLGAVVGTPVQLHWLKAQAPVPSPLLEQASIHTHVHAGTEVLFAKPQAIMPAVSEQLPWSWPLAVLFAWACIVLLQLYMAARQGLEGRALVRQATPVTDAGLQAVCARQARVLGLRRLPALRISHAIVSPQVSGLWRPVVLLPAEQTLSAEELAMAMAHELAHVRRGDLWLGWIPAIAQRLFFFHPLVRWAMREYAVYREAACDAQVLQHHGAAPRSYGHLLVRLGVVDPMHASLAGASSTFQNLKRRLLMLQQSETTPRMRSWLLVAAIALFGVLPYRITTASAGQTGAAAIVTPATSGVAYVPPAPPPAPPAVPAPPPPPPPAPPAPSFHAHHVDIDTQPHTDRGFVLLDGDTVVVDGSDADLALARRLSKTNGSLLWLRENGKSYVIRNADTIRQAKDIYAQSAQLAQAQGELAGKQGELAGQQAALAARQGALASRQSEIAGRRAAIQAQREASRTAPASPDSIGNEASLAGQLRGIDAEEAEVQRQSKAIDQAAAALSRQATDLSRHETAMSRQQQLSSQQMNKRLDEMLRSAIAKGLAKPVDQ